MLASCARRARSRLQAAPQAAEAASAWLLGGLSQPCELSTTPAQWARWPPCCEHAAAAAAGGATAGAWAVHVASSSGGKRTFTSTAAAQLVERRPEEQQGAGAAPVAGAGRAAAPQPTGTWLDRLPPAWVPYAQLMRLEKPVGTWLLAWPCLWSITLAAPPGTPPDPSLLALFGAGAVLLRGAGCTINDLWDRRLDAQVERTRGRPLAAGTVTPAQAVAFLGAQLAAGLAILLQLNPFAQALGASSLALVAAYPAMKRVTGWPQAFLGLTFNWGALLGWAAVHGACEWGVVGPLYASGVCWTLLYDTIYAHQDKADDARVGIRSTALTLGPRTKAACAGFGASAAALLAAAGHAAGCGPAFYAGVAAGAAHLGWQVAAVDLDDPADCAAKFASNAWYGALVWGGMLADRLAALPPLAGG